MRRALPSGHGEGGVSVKKKASSKKAGVKRTASKARALATKRRVPATKTKAKRMPAVKTVRLTPQGQRQKILLDANVPQTFLRLLAGLKKRDDALDCWMRNEKDAYFYLGDTLADGDVDPSSPWGCLVDQDVTPVYSGGNGDTFILLLTAKDGTRRFIDFGLEEGLLTDYGPNFQLVLANLVIGIFEFMDEASSDQIIAIATQLGFVRPKELVEALEQSSRPTFEADRAWRAEVLPRLIDGS